MFEQELVVEVYFCDLYFFTAYKLNLDFNKFCLTSYKFQNNCKIDDLLQIKILANTE